MIRRILVNFVLIVLCFVAQTSLFRVLSILGCSPNLLLIFVVSTGVMRGDIAGLFTGFFSGLLCDCFSGSVVGLFALIYMFAGFVCGKYRKSFYPENMMQPLSIIAVSDFVFGLLNFGLFFLLRGRTNFLFYLFRVIFPELIYTLLAALILYPVILIINTKLEDIESRSERKFV